MGKHKYIETPEKLLELFEKYLKKTKDNPRKKHTFVGKDGKSEYERLEVPLTMEGFRIFCFKEVGCVKQYFDNYENRYAEYLTICSYVKDVIRQDQIEGGMVGQYNPSITQRLNSLTEKTDVTTNGKEINEIKVNIIKPLKDEEQI